jgi:ribosomal protein S14
MKYLVAKDKKNRILYKQFEKKRILLKSIQVNNFLNFTVRGEAKNLLSNLVGYKSRIKNYCLITGRSRGILRRYNISRMLFKQYASFGYLKGIKKASW